MELRSLRIFLAISQSGSLVAAAGRLHLTPSAISHSLKSLETELGCRLFERVGRRMVLNQAGDQLLAGIREPLATLDTAAEGIRRLGRWGQSRLRIGAPAAACQHVLPGVIRELRKTYPALELRLESGNSLQLLDLVRESKIDLALCIVMDHPPGLESRPIFRDELMFAFAPDHPWAARRPITRDDILAQQFIGHHPSNHTSRLVHDYFRPLDAAPNVLMQVDSIGAIIEMVKLNLGVAVLAPWTVEDELVRGALKMRPLGARALKRQWSAVSLAVRPKTYVEETFCRLCRNQVTGMRLDQNDLPGGKPGTENRS